MVNKKIIMPKKAECVKFKNYERKIKPLFMIYVQFESILVSEDNEKQNSESLIRTNIKQILPPVIAIN